MTTSTRQVRAELTADPRTRREAKDAQLDRQDRDAAKGLADLNPRRALGRCQ